MLFNNLSLKIKLLGGFLLISSLVVVTSVISTSASNQLVILFQNVLQNDFQRYNTLLTIKDETNETINQVLIFTLQESTSDVDSVYHNEQKNAILANVEKINYNIDLYKRTIEEDKSGNVAKLNNLSALTDTVIDDAFQLISFREQQASTAAILAAQSTLIESQRILRESIENVVQKELDTIHAKDQQLEQTVTQTLRNVYVVSFVSVVIAIVAGFFFSVPIARRIGRLRNAFSEVAKGNLTIRLNDSSTDELGQLAKAFDQMTQNLKEVSEQKEKNAQELQKKSEELTQKMHETERINNLMLGRELKMVELKNELEKLRKN